MPLRPLANPAGLCFLMLLVLFLAAQCAAYATTFCDQCYSENLRLAKFFNALNAVAAVAVVAFLAWSIRALAARAEEAVGVAD